MKRVQVHQSCRMLINLLIAASLLLTIGCSRSEEEAASTEAVSTEAATAELEVVKSTGIPVTTASDAARSLYTEGQYFLDVGRGVQAREIFRAAAAEDPGFALAYYGQSNAALSFAEFHTALTQPRNIPKASVTASAC